MNRNYESKLSVWIVIILFIVFLWLNAHPDTWNSITLILFGAK